MTFRSMDDEQRPKKKDQEVEVEMEMEMEMKMEMKMEMESLLDAEGTYEQDIQEKKRKTNVSETVNLGSNGCYHCLSLSLRPLWQWHSLCRETPVFPYPMMSSGPPPPPPPILAASSRPSTSTWSASAQSPPTTSQPPFLDEYTHQTNHYSSESSSPPPPNRIPHFPLPLPVWAIPRQHRNRIVVRRDRKPDLTVAPYTWATTQRAIVHSLDYLISRQILVISGEVQCKKCKERFEMQYDLLEKFREIGVFMSQNDISMLDRAPSNWMSPNLPNCRYCRAEKSVTPYFPERKRSVNWLFLFLGEMIGCCRLAQLKYFCKQNDELRTGAKDRVVYSTYFEMCKQLDPSGESFLSLINSVQEQP